MVSLSGCRTCKRLIHQDEERCPYCDTETRSCGAPLSALATLSLSLGLSLGLTACGSRADPGETADAGDASGSGGSSVTSATGNDAVTDNGDSEVTSSNDDVTASSTSAETDYSSGGSFYGGGDWGSGNECGDECDIWAQNDCPEGQKCTAVACEIGSSAWDSNVCRDIQGDAQTGDLCMMTDGSSTSGNDTCAEGSLCWDPDPDSNVGTCVAFCEGPADSPSCEAGTLCGVNNDGVLPICLPTCDPLAQDCENTDNLCLPTPASDGYYCVLDASQQMAPYGAPCSYLNGCNTGLLCVDPAGVPEPECASAWGCCSPMCSLAAAEPCPGAGQTCEPVFDPQPPGYEDVGVCIIAM
jgi:hypothetical protein